MNEKNYGSLPACKKLYEAGIVLEADAVWVKWYLGSSTCYDRDPYEWRLIYKGLSESDCGSVPAPTMSEVWRELPNYIEEYGVFTSSKLNHLTTAGYRKGAAIREPEFSDPNPTDALIYILIWAKEKGIYKC